MSARHRLRLAGPAGRRVAVLIFAIRHGQTDWNVAERLQGTKDIALNAAGRAQATANGERLAHLLGSSASGFDYVASPLTRTRQTMELVRHAMNLDPQGYRTDDRLIELSFGDWEGRTLEEVARTDRGSVRARKGDKWHFLPPGEGAESYAMLAERVGEWLATVERPTVCVCHGGVIRSFFHLVGHLAGGEAAVADVPQDRVLRIDDAGARWL